jgi:hypothetical protein
MTPAGPGAWWEVVTYRQYWWCASNDREALPGAAEPAPHRPDVTF